MPPAKSSRTADDHRLDAGGPKEKSGGHLASVKLRRGASQIGAAQLREMVNSAPTSAPAHAAAEAAAPTLNWSALDRDALHAYRREYQLSTPTAFVSTYHQLVLSRAGSIGLCSPTMVRKRRDRRQSKEHLAMAVRKHFSDMGVQENDVIVRFIYKIRSDKAARAGGPNKQGPIAAK